MRLTFSSSMFSWALGLVAAGCGSEAAQPPGSHVVAPSAVLTFTSVDGRQYTSSKGANVRATPSSPPTYEFDVTVASSDGTILTIYGHLKADTFATGGATLPISPTGGMPGQGNAGMGIPPASTPITGSVQLAFSAGTVDGQLAGDSDAASGSLHGRLTVNCSKPETGQSGTGTGAPNSFEPDVDFSTEFCAALRPYR